MLRQARGTAAVAVLSCFLPLCSSDAHLSTGDDGVWWDSSVVQMERLANGARFFRVKDRFGLMVADAPQGFLDASLKHFGDCEASQWQAMSSFTTDTQRSAPAAYTCLHQRLLADKLLATFNADPSLARALRKSFNVSAPCKHREGRTDPKLGGSWIRNHVLYHLHPRFRGTRSWGSLLDEHTAPDAFHADGFEQLRRPAGADFFTVLHYPGDPKWADGWGGEFLLSAHAQLSGGEQREESERLVGMDGAVVRVAPRPDRIVVFSGQLLHRSTPPTPQWPTVPTPPSLRAATWKEHARVPHSARWRYASVMQLTCHNGAYHGPYEGPAEPPNMLPRLVAMCCALYVVGVIRGDVTPFWAAKEPPSANGGAPPAAAKTRGREATGVEASGLSRAERRHAKQRGGAQ